MANVYVIVQTDFDGDPWDPQLIGPFQNDDAAYLWCEEFEKTRVNTNYHNATISVAEVESPEEFVKSHVARTKPRAR